MGRWRRNSGSDYQSFNKIIHFFLALYCYFVVTLLKQINPMNVKVTQTQQTDIYSIKKEVMKARVEALFEDKKCPTLDRSVEEIYAMQPQELIDLYNQINPNLQAELL